MKPVETDEITVEFDAKKCIHARRCVLGLPAVFNPNARPWIAPENAPVEELARLIDNCPSGALSYRRKDGGCEEPAVPVNTAKPWENGPVEFRGDLQITDEPPRSRALLCRCGLSKNKPYCDNSHLDADFQASSEPPTAEDSADDLETPGGPLEIKPIENGPLMVVGNFEVIAGSGRRVATKQRTVICRCGASENKPFCDGTHKKIGFEAE